MDASLMKVLGTCGQSSGDPPEWWCIRDEQELLPPMGRQGQGQGHPAGAWRRGHRPSEA